MASYPMKQQFCGHCASVQWHNPLKVAGNNKTPEYRCVGCGHPKRYGAKNYALRENGKLVNLAKPA